MPWRPRLCPAIAYGDPGHACSMSIDRSILIRRPRGCQSHSDTIREVVDPPVPDLRSGLPVPCPVDRPALDPELALEVRQVVEVVPRLPGLRRGELDEPG